MIWIRHFAACFVMGMACGAPVMAAPLPLLFDADLGSLPPEQSYLDLRTELGSLTAVPDRPLLSSGPVQIDHQMYAVPFGGLPASFEAVARRFLESQQVGEILSHKFSGQQRLLNSSTNASYSIGAYLHESYVLTSAGQPGQPLSVGVEVSINGSLSRPTNPEPGIVQMQIVIDLLSEVNGNPVQTPLFSGGIFLGDAGDPQAIGSGLELGTFENERITYSSIPPIVGHVPLTEGEPFTLQGNIHSAIDADAFDSDDGSAWESAFANSIELRLIAPEGATFVPIPEPGGVALIVLAAGLMGSGRRRGRVAAGGKHR